MREELPKNEQIVFTRQNDKVKNNRGNTENTQRRYVSAASIITGLSLVLAALVLWLFHLLDILNLPQ